MMMITIMMMMMIKLIKLMMMVLMIVMTTTSRCAVFMLKLTWVLEPMFTGGVGVSVVVGFDVDGDSDVGLDVELDEGAERLEKILNEDDQIPAWAKVLCFALTSAGMMTLFGGTWGDFLASLAVGFLIGLLSLSKHFGVVAQLYEAIMALVATVLASLLT